MKRPLGGRRTLKTSADSPPYGYLVFANQPERDREPLMVDWDVVNQQRQVLFPV